MNELRNEYIKPYNGLKVLKNVTYMKIHGCVRRYATGNFIVCANEDGMV
jgi:hypothetical protein